LPERPAVTRTVALEYVTKVTPGSDPDLIFGAVNARLPLDRKVGILGRQGSGKSTLLGILAGTEPVDGGRVSSRVKFSMVLNGKAFTYAGMNGIENAEMMARIYGMPPKKLVELAMSLPYVPSAAWLEPFAELEPKQRRSMEILLASLLPYDCYLIDDIERADQNIVGQLVRLTAPRKAGLIFTTFQPKAARPYAEAGAVIASQTLTVFETMKEAEAFYG
jgi:capsular polysaccharide transport system ATP-binding protein